MHLRHKWETIFNDMGKVVYHYSYPGYASMRSDEKEVAFVIKRCSVCGKEQGYYVLLDGRSVGVDPAYIRARFDIPLDK